MPANTREILIGFSKQKQTDIATASLVANIWRMNKLNADFAGVRLNTENDAAEFGKGHEFAEQQFNVSWDGNFRLERYLTSDFAAWAFAYALGSQVKSSPETGAYQYVMVPKDLPTSETGLELPYFTFIEQVRPGIAGEIMDRALIGCAIESVTVQLNSGPGRQNAKILVECVGSGKLNENIGYTLPAATPDVSLPAGGATVLTIDGIDYLTGGSAKNLISLEYGFRNNIRMDEGFYIGSGFQTAGDSNSGAIRGRLEVGDRQAWLRWTARYDASSTEWAKLKAGTTGTAQVTLQGPTIAAAVKHKLDVLFAKVGIGVVDWQDNNGIITASCEATPMYSSGLLTVTAVCATDNICG
jgi:hypothetical protein